MAMLAMVAKEVTLWGLIELKMELLVQCVPSFLIALHWSRLRAKPAALGLVVGALIAVAGLVFGKRIGGVHIGIIGLAVNIAIAVAGTWLTRGSPVRREPLKLSA